MGISVIVPTLNEEFWIEKTLQALALCQSVSEVIIVDGGSTDRTCEIVKNCTALPFLKLVQTREASRGKQLHEGAKHASHEILWFVHADTIPKPDAGELIKNLLKDTTVSGGNFAIVFDGKNRWAQVLTRLYPYLRWLGLVYGDSAIFVRRESYEKIAGFRNFPIFEDVDLCQRLRKNGRFVTLPLAVTTSSRRFEKRNFASVFTGWMILQCLYWIGVPAKILGAYYAPNKK